MTPLARTMWALALASVLLAITAPNGFPLLLAGFTLYCLGWCCYRPKVRR